MATKRKLQQLRLSVGDELFEKLSTRDYCYVSCSGLREHVPSSFIIWCAKPRREVARRALDFAIRAFGVESADISFNYYPRNYIYQACELASRGMHEYTSTMELHGIIVELTEENRQFAESVNYVSIPLDEIPKSHFTGTYLNDRVSLPVFRDLNGYIGGAPSWMHDFPDGQKVLNGEPVDSLQKWITEVHIYRIVRQLFDADEVVFHYRGKELQGLELDIWVPKYALGVEYQGEQHFRPIDFFGGKSALEKRKKNDARKRRLCRMLNYTLIEFRYDESLSDSAIAAKISEAIGSV